jgi:hypothetical protein
MIDTQANAVMGEIDTQFMELFVADQASASPMFMDQESLESFYMVEFNQALPGLT